MSYQIQYDEQSKKNCKTFLKLNKATQHASVQDSSNTYTTQKVGHAYDSGLVNTDRQKKKRKSIPIDTDS